MKLPLCACVVDSAWFLPLKNFTIQEIKYFDVWYNVYFSRIFATECPIMFTTVFINMCNRWLQKQWTINIDSPYHLSYFLHNTNSVSSVRFGKCQFLHLFSYSKQPYKWSFFFSLSVSLFISLIVKPDKSVKSFLVQEGFEFHGSVGLFTFCNQHFFLSPFHRSFY